MNTFWHSSFGAGGIAYVFVVITGFSVQVSVALLHCLLLQLLLWHDMLCKVFTNSTMATCMQLWQLDFAHNLYSFDCFFIFSYFQRCQYIWSCQHFKLTQRFRWSSWFTYVIQKGLLWNQHFHKCTVVYIENKWCLVPYTTRWSCFHTGWPIDLCYHSIKTRIDLFLECWNIKNIFGDIPRKKAISHAHVQYTSPCL